MLKVVVWGLYEEDGSRGLLYIRNAASMSPSVAPSCSPSIASSVCPFVVSSSMPSVGPSMSPSIVLSGLPSNAPLSDILYSLSNTSSI
jgi:hypothetical protein